MKVIKVPGLNNLQKNDGCRDSGIAVLDELKKVVDVLDVESIELDNSNIDEQEKKIYEKAKSVLEEGRVAFLGGDHSISYSTCKAFLDVVGKEDSYLVVFDAHADCMSVWEGVKSPDHEEWLQALVEKGFDPKKIILIGLRKIELQERQFLDSKGIQYWEMDKFSDNEFLCDGIMEFVNKPNVKFYLSIDIDVVDPAFAPSTGHLEPGGFTSREFLYFIKRLALLKNLKAVDIVEIDCEKDRKENNNITVKLGAKILGEFLK